MVDVYHLIFSCCDAVTSPPFVCEGARTMVVELRVFSRTMPPRITEQLKGSRSASERSQSTWVYIFIIRILPL